MAGRGVLARLDKAVDDFCRRTRYFHEEMTKGRARMFAMQHRLNTRERNSVLKLKVAANCPDWETRIGIAPAARRSSPTTSTAAAARTGRSWRTWERASA